MLESLFNKVEGLNVFKKETLTQVFSCETCENFKDQDVNHLQKYSRC